MFHTTWILQMFQETTGRNAEGGMDHIGSELAEGNEDKAPPVKLRVGNDKVTLMDDLLAVEEKIQIDDPRPPLRPFGPTHPSFYLL
jgi:hypothetical protein